MMSCINDQNNLPPKPQKSIEALVVVGHGEKQELVVKENLIAPPSPPVFRIKDIDKTVVITDYKLVPIKNNDSKCSNPPYWGKVIINGYIDKNINYKTITDFTLTEVNGPVFQFTTQVQFATFVEVKSTVPLRDTDIVKIVKAEVEAEKEELLNPNPPQTGAPSWAITYNSILEKMVVFIKLKILRDETVLVD
jgi:hypothetical protein